MINFITSNWAEILLAVTAIARLTPTKKDDKIISKWGRLLNLIILKSREK